MLTTETGTKGSRHRTAGTEARADLSLGAQDTRTGPPVATAGRLRVRQQGPGVVAVPERDERGNISPDRAPDTGRTPVRKASLQGEPAARPSAARVAQEKRGDGGRREKGPDPWNRGPKRGQVAPHDCGRGEAGDVRRGCAEDEVEEKCEHPGAAHIELSCLSILIPGSAIVKPENATSPLPVPA